MRDPSPTPHRLIAASGGFLGPSRQARRIRRILELAGHKPQLGRPTANDAIAAWGHSPRAYRADALARRSGAPIWRIEDAFLRSVQPGRKSGEPPMGLLLDRSGMHYDPTTASDLEHILATEPFDDHQLISQARECLTRLRDLHLSKYNTHDITLPPPAPGYVLVIDQVRGDASVTHGGVNGPLPEAVFRDMLAAAQDEHPKARILIRAHPETKDGLRPGYFGPEIASGRVSFIEGAHSPWSLFEGAIAVYTVSSQMGFEAILAGHMPRVFGLPFYAGWELSADEQQVPRRTRKLTRHQLFAGAMLKYPLWYDPLRDQLCGLAEVIDQFQARLEPVRRDGGGYVATGMRLWKRPTLQQFFGTQKPVRFVNAPDRAKDLAQTQGQQVLGWASAVPAEFDGVRIEDGFLRSQGLGAALVPPLSLAVDDLGIYYDPTRESRFETLMMSPRAPHELARARVLRERILSAGVTKYNLGAVSAERDLATQISDLKTQKPNEPVILVPGQVEDDASIRLGTSEITTNGGLLQQVRAENPDAIVVYKPHPDVQAGLRPGALPPGHEALADLVATTCNAADALGIADELWTLTSGMGFEALLRGIPVTTLGAPFYAGWGLTRDLGAPPPRRKPLNTVEDRLDQLTYCALIAYPRYIDPVTKTPCPPELIIDRLASGQCPTPPARLRILSKLQGAAASQAWLWRR